MTPADIEKLYGDRDTLTQFLVWFLNQKIPIIQPPQDDPNVVIAHESVVTMTLFRMAPFQVELVILLPRSAPWPGQHRHPDVDSYEVALFNSVDFIKNGKVCNGPELEVLVDMHGQWVQPRQCVRLLPTDFHGTKPLVPGAALISVQQWLNGVPPTSVGKNWLGDPINDTHRDKILSAADALHVPVDSATIEKMVAEQQKES